MTNDFRLYEITNVIENLLMEINNIAEDNEGEIPENYSTLIDNLQIDRKKKILDIARYIKNLNAKSFAIKKEADKLYARYKAIDNYSSRLKKYLTDNIKQGERLQDNNTMLYWRKSEKVIIDSREEIPEYYYLTTKKLQLAALKRDIKNGDNIPGVLIEQKLNLQIK